MAAVAQSVDEDEERGLIRYYVFEYFNTVKSGTFSHNITGKKWASVHWKEELGAMA